MAHNLICLLILGTLVLPGCGGGGGGIDDAIGGGSNIVLRQAVYAGGGVYAYSKDLRVEGAPSDIDPQRWAVTFDWRSGNIVAYFIRKNGSLGVYRFDYDGPNNQFVYSNRFIPIDGVPADADRSNFGVLDDRDDVRLYMRSKSNPAVLHQFILNGTNGPFLLANAVAIAGLPPDADYSRWGIHHDGSDYRQLIFQRNSGTVLYQGAWHETVRHYVYGYRSTDVLSIQNMPSDTHANTVGSLYDFVTNKWQIYMRKR